MKNTIKFIRYLINNTIFFFVESRGFVCPKGIYGNLKYIIQFPMAHARFIKMIIGDYHNIKIIYKDGIKNYGDIL